MFSWKNVIPKLAFTFEKSLAKKRREKRRIVEATVLSVCHTAAIPIPIVKAMHEDDQL
jgi:tRNA A-37 threonylcarbamoyl transferase component Bud32